MLCDFLARVKEVYGQADNACSLLGYTPRTRHGRGWHARHSLFVWGTPGIYGMSAELAMFMRS